MNPTQASSSTTALPEAPSKQYSPVPAGHLSITIDDYAHFSETRASEGRRKGESVRILGMTWQLQAFFAFRAGAHNFQLSLVCEEGTEAHAEHNVAICLHIIGKATKEKKFTAQFNPDMKTWSCFMAHRSLDSFVANDKLVIEAYLYEGIPFRIWYINFSRKIGLRTTALEVDGRTFYVDKAYLSSVSPVFERMFGERFVEGTQDKIILEQLDAKEFEEFLLAIHQTQKEIKPSNVLSLMLLADQYDVLHLRSECESVILKDATLPLFDKLHLAVHLNSTALRDLLIHRASKEQIAELRHHEALKELGTDCLAELFKKANADGREGHIFELTQVEPTRRYPNAPT
ncbi:BTB/POZ domain-containing protein [Aphelenchoides avenae]|nr:BTB/POZ domain-containing protein [Aphelenchus avenae]